VYYNLKTNKYKIYRSDDFMVFSVGLSPTGQTGAYLYNGKYDVKVFKTETGSTITTLRGHLATPSIIRFVNENKIITGCDDGKVFFWKIKR
jgi:WD40 repeat protein